MYLNVARLYDYVFPQALQNATARGTLPPSFIHLKTNASFASTTGAEVKTSIGENLYIGVVGDAVVAEPKRISEFLQAAQINLLGLLIVGCVPANSTGYQSKGEEGFITGADGRSVLLQMTMDAHIKGMGWAVEVAGEHPPAHALAVWAAMAERASQLLAEKMTSGCALLQSCREHRQASLARLPPSISPAPRSDADKVADY